METSPTPSGSADINRRFGDIVDRLLPGKADTKLLAFCNSKFEQCKKDRLQFERKWYLNLAFYTGRQWVQWTPSTIGNYGRLYEPPVPSWRVRLVSNKVRPIIRSELAKAIKERPQGFVIPNSADDDDILAAEAGDQIFDHLWRTVRMSKVMRRAVFWTLVCGTGFIKDWYDPDAPDLNGVAGSVMAEQVTPFHIYVPDLQEEEIENQPYLIHGIGKTPEWVEDKFGVSIKPDSGGGDQQQQQLMGALGLKTQPGRYVAVKEMWCRPSKQYPDGLHVIWAANRILYSNLEEGDRWTGGHNEFPFTKIDHIPSGQFYASSAIEDLIPLQKEYNRTRSQIIEAKNRMSKPQLLAPRGSVDPRKITSEPGLVIFYTPGFNPPTPLPLQSLPSYVTQELEILQRDMDDVSGQHEVSKGRTPPGVTAATAISYLQEEDDSKLAPTIASIEEGVEKIGRHFLVYAQDYWDEPRIVKVVGDNASYESYQFTRKDIRGNTDFHVEPGSATPRSLAAKQAFIMEAYQGGLLPPDKALRYLNMAETNRMYQEMQVDSRHAQRENLKMAAGVGSELGPPQPQIDPMSGQPVGMLPPAPVGYPTNSWDEDMVHIVEHNLFRKRQAFENLPDNVKQVFDMHVETHKQRIAQMQGVQLPAGDPALNGIIRGIPAGGAGPQPPAPPAGGLPPGGGGMPQGGAPQPAMQ